MDHVGTRVQKVILHIQPANVGMWYIVFSTHYRSVFYCYCRVGMNSR